MDISPLLNISQKEAKDKSFKGKAVDAGWYSGSGNPQVLLSSATVQYLCKAKGSSMF